MGAVPGTAEDIGLIKTIFSKTLKEGKVDAVRFRATNDDCIDQLDRLERQQVLQRKDGVYVVTLYGLSLIDSPAIKKLRKSLERVFLILRRFYKKHPQEQLLVSNIRSEANLTDEEIGQTLNYLREISIFGGSTDLSSADAFVVPTEHILKFKKFDEAIGDHRRMLDFYSRNPSSAALDFRKAIGKKEEKHQSVKVGRGSLARSTNHGHPIWLKRIDKNVRQLMEEVYGASSINARALACMGLRAVIDLVFVEKLGDIGGFEQKLHAFEEKGFISERDSEVISVALSVGHASAHRGYVPLRQDLTSVLGIVENLLQRIYVIDPEVDGLGARVPKRK